MLSLYTFTLLAVIAGTATATPTPSVQLTNAERLAQGLAPNPPQPRSNERRQGPSAGAPSPTGPWAPGTFPTGTPESHLSEGDVDGYIACVEPNGHTYKFASSPNDQGLYTHTDDDGEVLEVTFDLGAATRAPGNIALDFPWWKIWKHFTSGEDFVAAIAGSDENSSILGPSRANFARIGAAEKTEGGAFPTKVDNTISDASGSPHFAQTQIWRYQDSDKSIHAQWHNFDGSTPEVSAFYDPQSNGFGLTGDLNAYKQVHNPEARECRLTFVPL